jgi:hypothetical protein
MQQNVEGSGWFGLRNPLKIANCLRLNATEPTFCCAFRIGNGLHCRSATTKRLKEAADRVRWIAADVTMVDLALGAYDVWHDRAVFHFLTSMEKRIAYVNAVARAIRPGGHVIVGTFGLKGPTKCSGLEVMRYDAELLQREFGARFRMVGTSEELHRTPSGTMQQFLYCYWQIA